MQSIFHLDETLSFQTTFWYNNLLEIIVKDHCTKNFNLSLYIRSEPIEKVTSFPEENSHSLQTKPLDFLKSQDVHQSMQNRF